MQPRGYLIVRNAKNFVFSALIMGALFYTPKVFAQSENINSAEYDLHARIPQVPYLNAGVHVFRVKGLEQSIYYTRPYFKPYLQKFGSKLDAECDGNSTPDDIVIIPLEVEFWSSEYQKQVSLEINALNDLETNPSDIIPYRHNSILISIGNGPHNSSETLVGQIPDLPSSLTSNIKLPATTDIAERKTFDIGAKCSDVANWKKLTNYGLKAAFVANLNEVKVDRSTVALSQALNNDLINKISRQEGAAGTYQIKGKLKKDGGSFNLGPVKFGGSKSKSKTVIKDTRKRWVTGDMLQNGIVDALSGLQVEEIVGSESTLDLSKTTEQLLSFVTSKSQLVEAQFKRTSEGQWEAVTDQFTATVSKAEIDSLIDSQQDTKLKAESDKDVSSGKQKAKTKDKFELGGKSNIKVEKKGEEWVPTSVSMYMVSESELRNSAKATYSRIVYSSAAKNLFEMYFVDQKVDKQANYFSGSIEQLKKQNSELIARLDDAGPFVTSITLNTNTHDSEFLNQTKLLEYCGDKDGCLFTINMQNWQASASRRTAQRGPYSLFIDRDSLEWRTSFRYKDDDVYGTSNDNKPKVVAEAWGCRFTDGSYQRSNTANDDSDQFSITALGSKHNIWGNSAYPRKGKICSVVIRD